MRPSRSRTGTTTEDRLIQSGGEEPGEGQETSKDEQTGEDGLLLQLSFDKTTQPDKGSATPSVEEGVTLTSDEGAYFSRDAQFVIPNAGNLKGEAGTISFWIEPDWNGDDPENAALVQMRTAAWANRLQIFKDGRFLRFLLTPDSGTESGVGVDISGWPRGEAQHITTTWTEAQTGQGILSMFINGRLVGQAPFDGQFQIPPGMDLRVGSDHLNQMPGARGVISEFKAFDHPLEQDRVAVLASGRK
jgi:hypothetical protein